MSSNQSINPLRKLRESSDTEFASRNSIKDVSSMYDVSSRKFTRQKINFQSESSTNSNDVSKRETFNTSYRQIPTKKKTILGEIDRTKVYQNLKPSDLSPHHQYFSSINDNAHALQTTTSP